MILPRVPTSFLPGDVPVALAIVHHGHQYLVTDGYDNHEGLSELLESYSTVLALHLKYRVPLNLHLSGTLIEAVAWHAPEFFEWIVALRSEGLVEILGSAYSQSILPLFSSDHNIRQLAEELDLIHRHLRLEPRDVRGFWVPERVWNTAALVPTLRSSSLTNGGYDYILIDDRLAYRLDGDGDSERRRFDRASVPARSAEAGYGTGDRRSRSDRGSYDGVDRRAPGAWLGPFGDGRHLKPWVIEGGRGLVALPIAGGLRYGIPPRDPPHWRLLDETLQAAGAAGEGAIAIYADDLEKSATVGPWTAGRWRREGVDAYEALLKWVNDSFTVNPVLLSPWLAGHRPDSSRALDAGTFYELAMDGAGEDYLGWWEAGAFAAYRGHLEVAESLLRNETHASGGADDGLVVECNGVKADHNHASSTHHGASSTHNGSQNHNGAGPNHNGKANHHAGVPAGNGARPGGNGSDPEHNGGGGGPPGVVAAGGLWDLAWKQLMAASYETGWHGFGGPAAEPAPWAKALASHARSVLVTAAAARWQARPCGLRAHRVDIDGDGEDELVLANDQLYVVLTPRYGGRVVAAFDLQPPGGRLVVGNPIDDWNWQEEVNRFMDVPRNHPGAFADWRHENDRYEIADIGFRGRSVEVALVNSEPRSDLAGSIKRYRLAPDRPELEVHYRLTSHPERFHVETALSPDYLALVREGRSVAHPLEAPRVRGWQAGASAVWVELPPGQPLVWDSPAQARCGHGFMLRVTAFRPAFTLRLGAGAAIDGRRRAEELEPIVLDAPQYIAPKAPQAAGTVEQG